MFKNRKEQDKEKREDTTETSLLAQQASISALFP